MRERSLPVLGGALGPWYGVGMTPQSRRKVVMSEQIILTLPTAVYQQAEALARDSGRPVADVLVETIERSLRDPSADDFSGLPQPQHADNQQAEIPWTWSK